MTGLKLHAIGLGHTNSSTGRQLDQAFFPKSPDPFLSRVGSGDKSNVTCPFIGYAQFGPHAQYYGVISVVLS